MIALAEDIPAEVITHILSHLDFRTIVRCRTVCTVFRDAIDTSPCCQWKIELGISCMEDGCTYPLDTCRKMLLEHQQGWEDLRWTTELKVPLHVSGLWDIRGNVHAQQSQDGSFIHFTQLPSQSRKIAEINWTLDFRKFAMHDFAFDPSQDLLVIIERPSSPYDNTWQIFLLTLLTGDPHPQATGVHPLLYSPRSNMTLYGRQRISISGDNLGILFEHNFLDETDIVIWNWKTGRVLANIIGDSMTTFTFLSDEYIMFGSKLQGMPGLSIINFVAESPKRRWLRDVENSFTFHFPILKDGVDCSCVLVQSETTPLWKPESRLSVPFFTSHENRLCAISLTVHADDSRPPNLHLITLTSALLSLIEQSGTKSGEFEWHRWGPDNTRMEIVDEGLIPPSWSRYTFGTRYVSTRQRAVGHRTDSVYVQDFNQRALRRSEIQRHNATGRDSEVEEGTVDNGEVEENWSNITRPTRIMGGDVFVDDVVTRLGYRERLWPIPGQPNIKDVMCTEDGIMIMYGPYEANTVEYHFLTV